MLRSNADPPHPLVDARISAVLSKLSTLPLWHEAWRRLSRQTAPRERLDVYREIRDSNVLPSDAGWYLIASQAEVIASDLAERELTEMETRLKALEALLDGNGDEDWPHGGVPAEYENLLEEFGAAWDVIFVRTLIEVGEHEMARCFELDREAFEEQIEAGRRYFHGESAPEWVEDLVEDVAGCAQADDVMAPFEVRCGVGEERWDIQIYPQLMEVVGGPADGAVLCPAYSVDLVELIALFDRVDAVRWNTHGDHGEEPPFVSVEGVYSGSDVRLRLCAYAPDGEKPRGKINVNRRMRPIRDEELGTE